MIVLTANPLETKTSVIRAAIEAHMVIDIPSKEVLSTMAKAYQLAKDHKGNEQGFYVGKKGRASIIVEGSQDSIGGTAHGPAREDLDKNKGDEPAYDVHTHGDSASAATNEFVWPSGTDTEDKNFKDRLEASVILSYEQETFHEAVVRTPEGMDLPPSTRIARRITFYYKRIKPVKISYSEFIKAVQKVAGTN